MLTMAVACTQDSSPTDPGPDPDPECYATLPDLDGSGHADDADCELATHASIVRTICEAEPEWSHLELCHGIGKTPFAWPRQGEVMAPIEFLVLDNPHTIIAHIWSIPQGGSGYNSDIWHDNDHDLIIDDDELGRLSRRMDSLSLGFSEDCISAAGTASGVDTTVYAWYDMNCNFREDVGESVAIRRPPSLGSGTPVASRSGNGRAVLAYTEDNSLVIWRDDNGDVLVDNNEKYRRQTVGVAEVTGVLYSQATFRDRDGYHTWEAEGSFFTFEDAQCVRVKYEPGTGAPYCSTPIGLRLPNGAVLGFSADAFTLSRDEDRRVAALGTNAERVIWIDGNEDLIPSPSEIVRRVLPSAQDGFWSGGAWVEGPTRVFVGPDPDQSDPGIASWAMERWWPQAATSYLGEPCGEEAHCTLGHECRVSGGPPEARCVRAR